MYDMTGIPEIAHAVIPEIFYRESMMTASPPTHAFGGDGVVVLGGDDGIKNLSPKSITNHQWLNDYT